MKEKSEEFMCPSCGHIVKVKVNGNRIECGCVDCTTVMVKVDGVKTELTRDSRRYGISSE